MLRSSRYTTGVLQRTSDDCLRCAVATFLSLRYEDVPHFLKSRDDPKECWVALAEWSGSFGLDMELTVEDPGIRCVAAGWSPRREEVKHAVVWHGSIEFDPHPSGVGIVGEPTYYVVLTPLRWAVCRWCGQIYENHRERNGPLVPRTPCAGLKSGFLIKKGT